MNTQIQKVAHILNMIQIALLAFLLGLQIADLVETLKRSK